MTAHTAPLTVPVVRMHTAPDCRVCWNLAAASRRKTEILPAVVFTELRDTDKVRVTCLCARHHMQYGRPLGLPGIKGARIEVSR